MMYTLAIVRPEAQKRSGWTGGVTTELGIFPPESSYAERTFAVRVSSATVELERSEFTSLPGFTRYIMPLQGCLQLEHNDRPEVCLAPFDVYRFEGGWHTVSHGACTDFNLMFRHGWDGEMRAVRFDKKFTCEPSRLLWLYSLEGLEVTLSASAGTERCSLNPGDVLYLQSNDETVDINILTVAGGGVIPAIMAKAWEQPKR